MTIGQKAAASGPTASDNDQLVRQIPEFMFLATRAQGTFFDIVMRQSIEALDFLRARLERDRELALRLGKAATPAEAVEAWTDFMKAAAEAYSVGSLHAARSVQSAIGDAVAEARHKAEDIVHEAHATAV